jgi:hypothetical protein
LIKSHFTYQNHIKAMGILGNSLVKAKSTGKRFLVRKSMGFG